MKDTITFFDHKHSQSKIAKSFAVVFSIVAAAGIGFFISSFFSDLEELDSGLIIFIPVFFAFFLLPALIAWMIAGRSKKTILDPSQKKITFYEGKKEIGSISFSEISGLEQSRYTYTVKSKNGSRTVTVYTVVSPHNKEIVLAESTDRLKIRNYAEVFAKTMRLSLTDEKGEKRESHELDVPFHKRNHPNYDSFSIPNFPASESLHWRQENGNNIISSTYNPGFLKILGIVFGVMLFFIANLSLGSMLELSVFYWEDFPPSITEIIFLAVTVFAGIFPIAYVYYQGVRKKEIVFTSDEVRYSGKSILYSEIESIDIENHRLYFVGDRSHLEISLFFFCDQSVYSLLLNASAHGILSQTLGQGNGQSFTTEF
ncbi:hypothetical protein [Leptospira idonii]|uniref:Uncharacterized protein n=1 Tax=Leptospira idonii TaxID=1193500 RepID=A0A4R9M1W0_9LEPT|nr:hypothetical protein [Leptospira idonii]TGN18738.1 hypothetical protein EHS15_15325 [Leptospira idonii]